MQLSPRYGTDPLIVLHGAPEAIAEPTIRQRRRLAERLATFGDDEWSHPTRCEAWSARDVIVHLDSTNTFWAFSIQMGLRGEPSQFLASFDPVASPAQLVDAASELSTADVLKRFTSSTDALVELLGSLRDDDWSTLAEAPPGHQSISAVAHHALWDSWVHERDILLPLGESPTVEPDEVEASLRYAAALAPALSISQHAGQRGVLELALDDPDARFVVEIGDRVDVRSDLDGASADLCLRGNAVDVLEALSVRRSLDQPVPDDAAWMLHGLATVFDLEQA